MTITRREVAAALLLPVPWAPTGKSWAAEPDHLLILERTIPLAGVAGRIDHMAVDLWRGRLLVAELGNGTVAVIDLAAGNVVRRLSGLNEPQGIGYAPKADLIAVACAGDGSVRLFQADGLSPVGVASLGDDADDVRLDAETGRFVVGYGGGGLAVLDPVTRSVTRRIGLPVHPEGFQVDPNAGRAYVNLPDAAGQVAVVDLASGDRVARWTVPGLRANFPMALDAAGAVLATVFRSPPRLVLLDTRAGAVMASVATCGDADDVFFDAKRRRFYVSCGQGAVAVVQQNAAGGHALARVESAPGARTSLFVPEFDRLFVAAPATGKPGSSAAILVFRPAP